MQEHVALLPMHKVLIKYQKSYQYGKKIILLLLIELSKIKIKHYILLRFFFFLVLQIDPRVSPVTKR